MTIDVLVSSPALASLPSPSQGVWHLGPIPLRAYAFFIVLGIVVAIWVGNKRWLARGGAPGVVGDIAVWAVPFGLIGARLYHVITDWEPYFGTGGDPLRAFRVWEGGLGIWGAIAGGVLGAWIACRRRGIPFPALADALAPGVVLAQGIGRWGNYFNQELYGGPTDLPWGLEIDFANRVPGYETVETFHPTFLYESLWAGGVALLVILADRQFRLGHGRAFALYVAAYTAGRAWIETLRIDPAHELWGQRLNFWTAVVVFLAAVIYIIVSARLRPGREDLAALTSPGDEAEPGSAAAREAEPGEEAGTAGGAEPEEPAPHDPASGGAEPEPTAMAEQAVDEADTAGSAAEETSAVVAEEERPR